MAIFVKYKKKVDEDTTTGQNQQQNDSANDPQKEAQITALRQEIVGKEEQKRAIQTDYENKVRVIDQQENQLKKKIADLGGSVENNESLKVFGKKLYEAIANKTDEMFALISLVFESMVNEDKLSFTPSTTRCMTFAKNIIAYINRGEFKQETVVKDFSDFLMNMLNASQVSFSNREKETFVSKLIEAMSENTLFSWIFSTETKNN